MNVFERQGHRRIVRKIVLMGEQKLTCLSGKRALTQGRLSKRRRRMSIGRRAAPVRQSRTHAAKDKNVTRCALPRCHLLQLISLQLFSLYGENEV
jgi:hypothetical protein